MSSPSVAAPRDPRAALADAVRLAALEATDLATPERAAALRPVVRIAARALRVPVALVNVLHADTQQSLVACPTTGEEPAAWEGTVPADASYCRHVVEHAAPLVISDSRRHLLVHDHVATRDGGIAAYAGVPVLAPASLGAPFAGRVLGTVCVVDFVPRHWTPDELGILADVAEAVTASLELRAVVARRAAADVATVAGDVLGRSDAARAESDFRFLALADAIPQLAWMADASGWIVWVNRRWLAYTGASAEQMVGWGWTQVHHPDHLDRVVTGWRAALEARRPWEDTFPLRGVDGGWRWFLTRALPVDDPVTGTTRWFGTNTDITERIALEAERARLLVGEQAARRAAEQANVAKSRFLAKMSHELRTPLNAIGGYRHLLELGLRGPITEAQRTDLQRIGAAQQHLQRLIEAVLDYARLEGGALRFDLRAVPVASLLEEVLPLVVPQAIASGVHHAVEHCDPDLAVCASCEKLGQVLVNLLANAVKFTPAGGRVRRTGACDGDDDDAVALAISDTGVGIPADKLEAIFEPFVQLDSALTRTAGGTGLGLAISRDLVHGMGGTLRVASEPGAGSTFTVVLPRAR